MGQLAFGVVGAVISTAAGAGPAIGWAVGSAIGGIVFAPDGPQTQGPRLEDLKSNVSTYGQPIPRAYGTIGFMGSLIWMDDIQETSSTTELDSKGGDPATATTFNYSCSFAMILCRGEDAEIDGTVEVETLTRIWVNEQCRYDIRDETNIEAIMASASFSQYFTFYPGSQTQEPDPTMEGILGVGNVPAYRGRAYVVFTDLPLGFVQNQPPGALRITFEVVMKGVPDTGLRIIQRVEDVIPQPTGGGSILYPLTSGLVRIGSRLHADGVKLYTVAGVYVGDEALTEEEEQWPTNTDDGYAPFSKGITRLYDGKQVRATALNVQYNNVNFLFHAIDEDGGTYDAFDIFPDPTRYHRGLIPCVDQRHLLAYSATGAANAIDEYYLIRWNGDSAEFELVETGFVTDAGFPDALPGIVGMASQGDWKCGMLEEDLQHVWHCSTNGSTFFELYEISGGVLTFVDDASSFEALGQSDVTCQAFNGLCYLYTASDLLFVATRNDGAADNDQTVADVHTAECLLAGLDSSQIDATALAAIPLEGMLVRRLGATRGVIQTLEPAYFYDTYESSGQLKARLRGSASVVTIDEEDLGASDRDQSDADLINPERSDEDSLPGECIVTYLDRASDYQVAAQHDRRSAVETDQPISLEMPLVFSPDEARQIASVWMYNQWAGRTRRTIKISRAYSYLEPTDVITISTSIADYVVRIVAVKTNDGFLELECVDEDAALYDQNAEGANIDQGTELTLATPSKVVLLDIPMLRESDNNPGFYIAMAGYGDGWPGGTLLRSTDGGVTYSNVATITTPAIIGTVSTALGDFGGPLGYDAVNLIDVTLTSDYTLTSCTDAELLGGANAFALGNETIGFELAQFKTATLLTGRTWRLAQLSRGRRGTEHRMGSHTTLETFVLLQTATLRRIAIDDPSIGVENHYKAVTFGQLVTLAATKTFTNTAESLKPYSPVMPGATGFGGDVTITWIRRGRIFNDWANGVTLSLGEATESYSIDVYDGVTFKRTLTSTSPSVVYSSANQTTDFGGTISPGDATVHIFQISAIVGRGFPLIATL